MTTPAFVLVRTSTGERLHLERCYHLGDAPVVPASITDRESMPVCDVCQADLDGHGRTYVATLEEAFRKFGTFAQTVKAIRSEVAGVEYDQIWLPYSNSYIALGKNGAAVAWIGKTYIDRPGGGRIELPGYRVGGGGGGTKVERSVEIHRCGLAVPCFC